MGPIATSCLLLIIIANVLAIFSRDWRLRMVCAAFLLIWFGSQFDVPNFRIPWLDPLYTFGIVVLVFVIQARGRIERLRGEPLAMWLMVPFTCELLIASAYPFTDLLGYKTVYRIITVLFYVELLTVIYIGAKRLRILPNRWLYG